MIERVQNKFLRFMSYKLNDPMPITCHNYQPIMAKLGLMTLENRRTISDLLFVYNLLNGNIDCSSILKLIKFYAPIRIIRRTSLLYIEPQRTVLGKFHAINRIASHVNVYSTKIDLFDGSVTSFKQSIFKAINC